MTDNITGRIMQRNDTWYLVVNLKDEKGKYKPKWISTGLKGDRLKAEAEELLVKKIYELKHGETTSKFNNSSSEKILFADFLWEWLEHRKNGTKRRPPISETTYADYSRRINTIMYPYFKEKNIYLQDITEDDIDEYYDMLKTKRGNSNNTINKHHATIHSTLKYAFKKKLTLTNVSDLVERGQVITQPVEYYNTTQIKKLLKIIEGDEFEIFVVLGITAGLRRGEILGLKWSAIDFDNNTFMVNHTVVSAKHQCGQVTIRKDSCKNKKSTRALPLAVYTKNLLLKIKAEQSLYRALCGNEYYQGDLDYVCKDKMGHLIKPDFISQHFNLLLKKNGLPHIKFHALRHSCASALLAQGMSLKLVQEYLGHSTYETTDKHYGHLEMSDKIGAVHVFDDMIDM